MTGKQGSKIFKVVVVGNGSVGKTSAIVRFTTNSFRENYIPTLGVGFARKDLTIQDKRVVLQIWDLGGQDYLDKVRANFYAAAHGVMLIYDVTQRDTFDELLSWKEEVDSHVDNYRMMLIANKVDLVSNRVVISYEGVSLAKRLGAEYVETSAKTGLNVNEAFEKLAVIILAERT